ncbi:MAG: tRNA (N(6)-L-threonylcarbamoyladenosine(37)-C(2))-methylthiotransferase MtaB [Chloroflexi bacterium]|nr:tRNA (N(6)-L-threonylcarbamoyladenosine(37)-C(2))-methylthiotransferase MtaB [Chloroflexota bacterium]
MKIALETLGCKLNQAETEALVRQLVEAGHQIVALVDEADIYILNTCTVTQTADAKSRHLLRLAHRKNAKTMLVATGCYAQRAPEELEKLVGVSLVAGNDEKESLPYLLDELACADGVCLIPEASDGSDESVSRTRAFIKIQDGCNKFCSYCIVPLVRGGEKSQPAEQIVAEVRERVDSGIKEVVLTGTEVGAYDDNGTDLKQLLERILAETDIVRLRLSSLQPQEITQDLIGLWRDRRLCPHFHLSLQSGSDAVLKRMRRGYSISDYQQSVSLIRAKVPDVAITTDVIAGFPGETDAEFEESLRFCREMGFARVHVFSYSPRRGTEAAAARNQVGDKVKKQRNQTLLALAQESAAKFMQGFFGRTLTVLFEQQTDGVWSGHTANYIKVYTKSAEDMANSLLSVRLTEIRGDGVWWAVEDAGWK